MGEKHTGSCLCGGVSYEVAGDMRYVVACHCVQCRKTSGHHVAATRTAVADLNILSDETLTWFQSSPEAARGFCNRCGGNVFWQRTGANAVSIMAGTLDDPVKLPFKRHIFAKYKADYITLPADAEVFAESD